MTREVPKRTLSAFVRERARRQALNTPTGESDTKPAPNKPPTDIAAVLAVIVRRSAMNRWREKRKGWRLNFESVSLKGAALSEADFEGANLTEVDLTGAKLIRANLTETDLNDVDLTGADLSSSELAKTTGLSQSQLDAAWGTNVKLPPDLVLDKPRPAPGASTA